MNEASTDREKLRGWPMGDSSDPLEDSLLWQLSRSAGSWPFARTAGKAAPYVFGPIANFGET
jgi:hypothetical protein